MQLVFGSSLEADGLVVEVVHPTVRPERRGGYLLRLLRRVVPDAPAEMLRDAAPFATELGWPGKLIGQRNALAARYDLFHFVAGVVIAETTEGALAAASQEIRAFLLSARPDFSGGLACLSALWS